MLFRSLAVLGRDEDAADQISAYFMLSGYEREDQEYGIAGAIWYFRTNSSSSRRHHFSDEHSSPAQRRVNIACWAYGKDPQVFDWVLKAATVPRRRALRCEQEYEQLQRSIRQLLGSSLK